MGLDSHPNNSVAIVTGGASGSGRAIARGLAGLGWSVVLVYLDSQSQAEATVADIITAGGTAVGVRADLADDLDVSRLYTESLAAFGVVDAVVVTATESTALLYEHAAGYVRPRGFVASTPEVDEMSPEQEALLAEREIRVRRVPSGKVPAFLEAWRQQNHT